MSVRELQFEDFCQEIGYYLGYGKEIDTSNLPTTLSKWSTAKYNHIKDIVNEGLATFYRENAWSFLKPETSMTIWGTIEGTCTGVYDTTTYTTITTTDATFYPSCYGQTITIDIAGTDTDFTVALYVSATVIKVLGDATCAASDFTMSSDGTFWLDETFGAIDGPITFTDEWTTNCIMLTAPEIVRTIRQVNVSTGAPERACVQAVTPATDVSTRYQITFDKVPDAVYGIKFTMLVLQAELSPTNPHPIGGPSHNNTILSAMKAVAERFLYKQAGVEEAEYQRRLKLSFGLDKTVGPRAMGVMRDSSDVPRPWMKRAYRFGTLVYTPGGP